MKIKSLLLGSAAALVAATGARAADAVVIAEPEPVEYVRVCDAYGAGYFYIPGTETCLRISGYLWYQIGTNNFDPDALDPQTPPYIGGTAGEGWYKQTRARVQFDANSETEWGTLRARIRMQATWGFNGDGPVTIDQGYLQLGGLMMGYSESFFVDSKNGGASNYGSHSWGGMYYGYQQRHLIGYRFEGGNGFFGAVALENDSDAFGNPSGDGYMPDIVGKLGISQGWGTVWAVIGYDESISAAFDPVPDDDGIAVQLGAQFNIPNSPGSSLRLLGYYNDSDNAYGPGSPLGVDPEWSILVSYLQQFTPTLGVSAAFQYFSDLYLPASDVSSGLDAWGTELSVVWTPITNFEVRFEGHYDEVDELDGTVSGFLRFTRYF